MRLCLKLRPTDLRSPALLPRHHFPLRLLHLINNGCLSGTLSPFSHVLRHKVALEPGRVISIYVSLGPAQPRLQFPTALNHPAATVITTAPKAVMPTIPLPYIVFFLWVEPLATLTGAFYAWFQPIEYLHLTHAASTPEKLLGLPISTHVVLRQLGNLYLAFALNEALVLRATNDLKVWRALLLGLLIADFGHLLSCYPLGIQAYYNLTNWNAIAYGNYLFVYCGATFRACFLLNVGMGGPKRAKQRARKSIKSATDELAELTPSPSQMNKTPAQSTRRRKNKSVSGS